MMKFKTLLTASTMAFVGCISSVQADCQVKWNQLFVSKGPESGKGQVVLTDANGVPQTPMDASKLVKTFPNCDGKSVSYSFRAVRYGNSNMDIASGGFRFYTDTRDNPVSVGDDAVELPKDLRVSDFSDADANMREFSGEVSLSQKPSWVEMEVVPGDWGVQLQQVTLSVHK